MKVILQQDIPHLGRKNEVRDVSDGYARNFLIARGIAKPATDAALQSIAAEKTRREKEQSAEYKKFKMLAEKISRTLLHFRMKIGEKSKKTGGIFAGSLPAEASRASVTRKRSPGVPEEGKRAFGSVTAAKIKEALQKEGIAVEKEWLELNNSIKTTGETKVKMKLPHEIKTEIKIFIEAE